VDDDSSSSPAFRVAIVGGGIGGLATALSLATYNPTLTEANITVYEQAPAYSEIGAGVGIGVSAGRVLQKLGVWEAASAISGRRTGVHRSNRRWDTDELIVNALAFDGPKGQDEVKQLWAHRADFLQVLYDEIQRRKCARLETNKRVVRIEVSLKKRIFMLEDFDSLRSFSPPQVFPLPGLSLPSFLLSSPPFSDSREKQDKGSTVLLSFADGTSATANLVVGCDGIHSTIRSHFAVDNPVYSGRIAFRGVIPFPDAVAASPSQFGPDSSSWTVSWLGPPSAEHDGGKHFLVFPMSQDRLLNVVAFVRAPEGDLGGLKESWKSEAPRSAIERAFAGWCEPVQKIMAAMPSTISRWKINDRELLSRWCHMDGKVVLAGDAAHAMLPQQGSGAGLSIEDANVIGLAVRDHLARGGGGPPLSTYTDLYEATRLPRAQKAQVTSRQAADVYDMHGPDFERCHTYEECLEVVKDKVETRMAWVWKGDLEADYAAAKGKMGVP
jgi:salicylate hydroxylase